MMMYLKFVMLEIVIIITRKILVKLLLNSRKLMFTGNLNLSSSKVLDLSITKLASTNSLSLLVLITL